MKRRILGLTVVTLLALASVPAAYAGGTESYGMSTKTSPDAMYLGSVIFICLAVPTAILGVMLGVRRNETTHAAGIGSYFIVGGALLVVLSQGATMLMSCCPVYFTGYQNLLGMTLGGATLIVIGAGIIATGRFASSNGRSVDGTD